MKGWLTIRNGLGMALLVWFMRLMQPFLDFHRPGLSDFAHALLAMAVLILAVIMLSDSLAEWFTRPLCGFIDYIYYGNNQAEPPPVTLRLTRLYRNEQRHADAIRECERQLDYHPRSPELWVELVQSARESGDPELLQKSERQARRRLKGEDRERFEQEISRRGMWVGYGESKALR